MIYFCSISSKSTKISMFEISYLESINSQFLLISPFLPQATPRSSLPQATPYPNHSSTNQSLLFMKSSFHESQKSKPETRGINFGPILLLKEKEKPLISPYRPKSLSSFSNNVHSSPITSQKMLQSPFEPTKTQNETGLFLTKDLKFSEWPESYAYKTFQTFKNVLGGLKKPMSNQINPIKREKSPITSSSFSLKANGPLEAHSSFNQNPKPLSKEKSHWPQSQYSKESKRNLKDETADEERDTKETETNQPKSQKNFHERNSSMIALSGDPQTNAKMTPDPNGRPISTSFHKKTISSLVFSSKKPQPFFVSKGFPSVSLKKKKKENSEESISGLKEQNFVKNTRMVPSSLSRNLEVDEQKPKDSEEEFDGNGRSSLSRVSLSIKQKSFFSVLKCRDTTEEIMSGASFQKKKAEEVLTNLKESSQIPKKFRRQRVRSSFGVGITKGNGAENQKEPGVQEEREIRSQNGSGKERANPKSQEATQQNQFEVLKARPSRRKSEEKARFLGVPSFSFAKNDKGTDIPSVLERLVRESQKFSNVQLVFDQQSHLERDLVKFDQSIKKGVFYASNLIRSPPLNFVETIGIQLPKTKSILFFVIGL